LVAEVHPKIVQDMLGHSTVLTTLDTYSHVMPTLQAEAIRRLDLLLAGIQPPTARPAAEAIADEWSRGSMNRTDPGRQWPIPTMV